MTKHRLRDWLSSRISGGYGTPDLRVIPAGCEVLQERVIKRRDDCFRGAPSTDDCFGGALGTVD